MVYSVWIESLASNALSSDNKPINAAIIVAAGRGERAGQSGGPKQYRMLNGKSILERTISAFTGHNGVDLVKVVIHRDDLKLYNLLTSKHPKLAAPCFGGETRQASVLCGLRAIAEQSSGKVLIHDAARPFVSASLIDNVIDSTTSQSGALPVMPLSDTIKMASDGMVVETVPREGLYAAQTPQGFEYSAILSAHEKAALQSDETFTDDASIAEWANIPIKIVDGDVGNKKLTVPEDFVMAEKSLGGLIPDIRTGNGYDVHAFEQGNSVRLCGVDIAHNAKLMGHSDADVGLHALTDALLGTIADGDIGSHFPPSDPKWKNANSEQFFRHAVDLVEKHGGVITHLDTTLICEMPKIGPHRDKMRIEIARMANVAIERVSVKATTNERLGFIGREEGIASIATATVVLKN